jgi:hypothetical protein
VRAGKSLKLIGSSGRTRTYNPSVNSTREAFCCWLLLLTVDLSNQTLARGLQSHAITADYCCFMPRVPGIFTGTDALCLASAGWTSQKGARYNLPIRVRRNHC